MDGKADAFILKKKKKIRNGIRMEVLIDIWLIADVVYIDISVLCQSSTSEARIWENDAFIIR